MNITLAADVGDDERSLLVPQARAGVRDGRHGRRGRRARPPARRRAGRRALRPPPRRASARPSPIPTGVCASRSRSGPTRRRRRSRRVSSRSSTARSSRRSSSCAAPTSASPRSSAPIREPGALADTAGYSPDLTFEQKVELLEAVDVVERLELAVRFQRERLAELQVRTAHPRGRRVRRAEAAARVLPPQAARLDPQGARRGRGVGRRRVPPEDRRGRHARRRARAGRARARAARAHGRRERRGRR